MFNHGESRLAPTDAKKNSISGFVHLHKLQKHPWSAVWVSFL